MKMDDYFESQGYERISKTLVTSLDDKLNYPKKLMVFMKMRIHRRSM